MAPHKQLHDIFEQHDDHIIVHSKSGHTYTITYVHIVGDNSKLEPICTCPGFGYRSTCRHIEEAQRVYPIPMPPSITTPTSPTLYTPNPTMLHNVDICTGKVPPDIHPRRTPHA